MNRYVGRKLKGFTLVEILLVIVIVVMVLYGVMSYIQQRTLQQKISRTSAQMKQILNASLSYYVQNGTWPSSLACLQGIGCAVTYLPSNLQSPWGTQYYTTTNGSYTIINGTAITGGTTFYVVAEITSQKNSGSAAAIAQEIAGTLPLGYVSNQSLTPQLIGPGLPAPPGPPPVSSCSASSTTCYVAASVNLPPQTLNNAKAVNFSGLYHHGGCVPVPQCPVDPMSGLPMVPQVFVAPVSVSGLNDPNSNSNVYPIESFTAYATASAATPASCNQTSPSGGSTACGGSSPTGLYWRACLQIYTEKGLVNTPEAEQTWGEMVTLLAITRCAVSTEPAGSAFTVYQ